MTKGPGNEDAGAYDNRDRAQGIMDDPCGDESEHDGSTDGDWVDTRSLEKAGRGEEERGSQKAPRPPLEDRSVESRPHTH